MTIENIIFRRTLKEGLHTVQVYELKEVTELLPEATTETIKGIDVNFEIFHDGGKAKLGWYNQFYMQRDVRRIADQFDTDFTGYEDFIEYLLSHKLVLKLERIDGYDRWSVPEASEVRNAKEAAKKAEAAK